MRWESKSFIIYIEVDCSVKNAETELILELELLKVSYLFS